MVEYAPAAGGSPRVVSVALTRNAGLTGKVALTGLSPATGYTYRLRHGGERIEGSFVTAPARDHARAVTFLWSGDLGGGRQCRHIHDGYPIFRPMAQRKPDFFLFVGDTIYADIRCGGPNWEIGRAHV